MLLKLVPVTEQKMEIPTNNAAAVSPSTLRLVVLEVVSMGLDSKPIILGSVDVVAGVSNVIMNSLLGGCVKTSDKR